MCIVFLCLSLPFFPTSYIYIHPFFFYLISLSVYMSSPLPISCLSPSSILHPLHIIHPSLYCFSLPLLLSHRTQSSLPPSLPHTPILSLSHLPFSPRCIPVYLSPSLYKYCPYLFPLSLSLSLSLLSLSPPLLSSPSPIHASVCHFPSSPCLSLQSWRLNLSKCVSNSPTLGTNLQPLRVFCLPQIC